MTIGVFVLGLVTVKRTLRAALAFLAYCGFAHAVFAADAELVEKGRYIAIASDCVACHTNPNGGKPFAGGYGIVSPLGTIYSSNITPSKSGGIGAYTEEQFASALREGVRADGARLYPAMPYTSYAGMTDADIHALYTYLMNGVAPVDEVPFQTKLPFPFNIRLSMIGWNWLFLDRNRFQPDATKSPEWNRGAYLTTVLGHCSACHTPRNFLMAETSSKAFAGASLGSWYAPNITSDPVSGIGGWSNAELVQYLKSGAVPGKGQVGGGMAEAVENSLQFLRDDDLAAIAVFMKTIPAIRHPAQTQPAFTFARSASLEAELRGTSKQDSNKAVVGGAALFSAYCASCHQPTGVGTRDQSYPSLSRNSATGGLNADNMISAVLFGVDRTVAGQHVLMPRFDQTSFVASLSNEQIAEISNYVMQQFGNPQIHVTNTDVSIIRAGGPTPPLALVSTYMPHFLIVLATIVTAILFGLIRRRNDGNVRSMHP